MTVGWRLLEWLLKATKWRERLDGPCFAGWYFPRAEPRVIPEGARVHYSVIARRDNDPSYRPPNLPVKFEVEGHPINIEPA